MRAKEPRRKNKKHPALAATLIASSSRCETLTIEFSDFWLSTTMSEWGIDSQDQNVKSYAGDHGELLIPS